MIEVTKALYNKFKNMSFVCACLVVLIHISSVPDKGSRKLMPKGTRFLLGGR